MMIKLIPPIWSLTTAAALAVDGLLVAYSAVDLLAGAIVALQLFTIALAVRQGNKLAAVETGNEYRPGRDEVIERDAKIRDELCGMITTEGRRQERIHRELLRQIETNRDEITRDLRVPIEALATRIAGLEAGVDLLRKSANPEGGRIE